jgi:hypothetical protein
VKQPGRDGRGFGRSVKAAGSGNKGMDRDPDAVARMRRCALRDKADGQQGIQPRSHPAWAYAFARASEDFLVEQYRRNFDRWRETRQDTQQAPGLRAAASFQGIKRYLPCSRQRRLLVLPASEQVSESRSKTIYVCIERAHWSERGGQVSASLMQRKGESSQPGGKPGRGRPRACGASKVKQDLGPVIIT